MQEREIKIVNPRGVHGRASARIAQLAAQFRCSVALHVKGRHANARSIMAVMLLAASMGSTVRLETNGVDEQEAMAALTSLIRDGFRDSL